MMDIFFDQTKIGTKNWVILRMFNKNIALMLMRFKHLKPKYKKSTM